jgi:hypothetical protein
LKAVTELRPHAGDLEASLKVLDGLREGLVAGKFVAFAAVGVEPSLGLEYFTGTTRATSRLVMMGAVAFLQHWFAARDWEAQDV